MTAGREESCDQIAQIQAAAERIRGRIHRTPIFSASSIGERAGVSLRLKCENFQKTGSFKPRGALNKILTLSPEERAKGLVTVSAGKHAQAVAWAAWIRRRRRRIRPGLRSPN